VRGGRLPDKSRSIVLELEDEPERELREAEREEARLARLARLRARRLEEELRVRELEAKLEKLRREGESGSANYTSSAGAGATILAELVRMGFKPEQVNELFSKLSPEAVATLSMLSNPPRNTNDWLPLLLLMRQQSLQPPPSPQPHGHGEGAWQVVAESIRQMGNVVATVLNNRQQPQMDETTREVLKAVGDLVRKAASEALEPKAPPSLVDELEKYKKMKEVLGDDLGRLADTLEKLRKAGLIQDPQAYLKALELRLEHEAKKYEIDKQFEAKKLEMEAEKERIAKLAGWFNDLANIVESLTKSGQAGQGQGQATATTTTATAALQSKVRIQCPSCKGKMTVPVEELRTGNRVTCPSCKAILEISVPELA
jgi:hypothetical protein